MNCATHRTVKAPLENPIRIIWSFGVDQFRQMKVYAARIALERPKCRFVSFQNFLCEHEVPTHLYQSSHPKYWRLSPCPYQLLVDSEQFVCTSFYSLSSYHLGPLASS